MDKIKSIYTKKAVIAAIIIFVLSLYCLIIFCTTFGTKELSEKRLLTVYGISADEDGYLYVNTNMGVLVTLDGICVGKLNVEPYKFLRMTVDKGDVITYNSSVEKGLRTFSRDGREKEPSYAYPLEYFEKNTAAKGENTYKVHRIFGYTYITENGKTVYHSPVWEYVVSKAWLLIFPSFLYLGLGLVATTYLNLIRFKTEYTGEWLRQKPSQ